MQRTSLTLLILGLSCGFVTADEGMWLFNDLPKDDIREKYGFEADEMEESQQQAYAKITAASYAVQGTNTYPDATFTLRLAFGIVAGYEEGGRPVPPWTTIRGAFESEQLHGGDEPWRLPESWTSRKDKLNLDTPFNFVSTVDIIGGNSGSPIINREAQLVGVIFDGNIQSLTARYFYSDKTSRAVSVHSNAIVEALRNVYDADRLVEELGK